MPKDLLLEIGTEEMPASAVEAGIKQLEEAHRFLKNYRISFQSMLVKGSPRRLVLIVRKVVERQEKILHETKGPARQVAFDSKKPTAAAIGFAKSQGISVESLLIRETPQGEYVFAVKEEQGQPVIEVLPQLLREIILSLSFSKSMRWEDGDLRFVRPIRWLLALWDSKVIPLEIGSLKASNKTWGHRFLSEKNPLTVKKVDDYEQLLKNAGKVIIDHRKKRDYILKQIEDIAAQHSGKAVIDEETFREVIHLVEYPHAIYGHFSDEFLSLPREVLVTAMEAHQRYFPVEDEEGNLKSGFIAVHNGDENFAGLITRGHQRVLQARLADAKFFFEEDQKLPLYQRTEGLKGVTYQEKLGTVFLKVMRIQKLSTTIADVLGADPNVKDYAGRASYLCKSDLVTNMVVEFPVLQGVMGKEYALLSGEPAEVATAIYEHYLPKSAGDELPSSLTGKIVSISDKIDTIVSSLAVGLIPTSSEDPYALRRQAQGIVSIILDNQFILPLQKLISACLEMLNEQEVKFNSMKTHEEVESLFKQRMRQTILGRGLSYDVADAVLSFKLEDLLDIYKRAVAIGKYQGKKEMEDLLTAFYRCNNLAEPEYGSWVKKELIIEEAENQLAHALDRAASELAHAIGESNYEQAIKILAGLRPTIDFFFDKVLVMTEDEKLRKNRLCILNRAVEIFQAVADFSKLVSPNSN